MNEKPETKPETSDRVRLERVVRPGVVYLAVFKWPGYDEPLLLGTCKKTLAKAAKEKAVALYGSGPVLRPRAMCSTKITLDDIGIEPIGWA